ncbi:MAG: DUF2252 family protein [Magnetococcales bacterium]|nr:DUF2252 family protein [Magnetococcales bacterium]
MDKQTVINHCHTLYPHLSRADIKNKIRFAKNSGSNRLEREFLLFRALVPLFYDLLRQEKILSGLGKAGKEEGWCVGDPHMENFGFVHTGCPCAGKADGRYKFVANDPDDGAHGYPVADLLRYLVNYHFAGSSYDRDKAINCYLKGLQGKSRSSCHDGSMKKLRKKLSDPSDLYEWQHGRWRLIRDHKIYSLLCDIDECQAKTILHDAVLQACPEYVICDSFQFKKDGGGSGGLLQYRFLLSKLKKSDNNPCSDHNNKSLIVIDLKPELRSSTYPLHCLCGKQLAAPSQQLCSLQPKRIVKRVKKNLHVERGGKSSCKPLAIPPLGAFLLRFRNPGEAGVSISQMQDEQIKKKEMIRLECHTLGKTHRRGLQHPHPFAKQIDKKRAEIKKATKKMIRLLQHQFSTII